MLISLVTLGNVLGMMKLKMINQFKDGPKIEDWNDSKWSSVICMAPPCVCRHD